MREAHKGTISWFGSTAVSVGQYFLFSSLALVVIFAWMEPAGAAGIGFWRGLLFWAIQISILIPLLITIQHLASHYIDLRTPQVAWIQTALSGIIGALIFVPMAYYLDTLFVIPDNSLTSGLIAGLLDEAMGVVVPVTVTWLALNAPWILQLDFSKREPDDASQGEAPNEKEGSNLAQLPTRFIQELRTRVSGELISISSELHYLRVVTTEAEVMFLYNLKDAIAELPSDSGIQIHRSHWVARAHVKEIVKKNGNSVCLLSNGTKLPVSRRKFAEVKDLLIAEV
jgi:hypothetical protein